ncbi:nuclease-related domain-containing protein [Deinococcus malanensis]|nr:NERD domain-containing protein [Deinococcus malanensis]
MIVKDHQAPPTSDRFQRAGDEAEKQMAFYLRRAYGSDPDVHVFHNLRFERGQEAAQIDHLVLHRSGAIIVESKSVTSAVRINEREEWARQWNGRWAGMPSPVLQAKRQADFLRSFLDAHKEDLLGKALFGLKQKTFRAFVIDVVVAISDQGVVQHKGKLPDVRKADQVPDRVRQLIADHIQLAHPLSKDPRSNTWGVTITPEELARVSAFLRARHTPRVQEGDPTASAPAGSTLSAPTATYGRYATPPPGASPALSVSVEPPPPSAPVSVPPAPMATASGPSAVTCRHCQSSNVEVAYGKYGYYIKCLDCDGNTRIQLTCPTCQAKAKLRKAGSEFFAECSACDSSTLYHRNQPSGRA